MEHFVRANVLYFVTKYVADEAKSRGIKIPPGVNPKALSTSILVANLFDDIQILRKYKLGMFISTWGFYVEPKVQRIMMNLALTKFLSAKIGKGLGSRYTIGLYGIAGSVILHHWFYGKSGHLCPDFKEFMDAHSGITKEHLKTIRGDFETYGWVRYSENTNNKGMVRFIGGTALRSLANLALTFGATYGIIFAMKRKNLKQIFQRYLVDVGILFATFQMAIIGPTVWNRWFNQNTRYPSDLKVLHPMLIRLWLGLACMSIGLGNRSRIGVLGFYLMSQVLNIRLAEQDLSHLTPLVTLGIMIATAPKSKTFSRILSDMNYPMTS